MPHQSASYPKNKCTKSTSTYVPTISYREYEEGRVSVSVKAPGLSLARSDRTHVVYVVRTTDPCRVCVRSKIACVPKIYLCSFDIKVGSYCCRGRKQALTEPRLL